MNEDGFPHISQIPHLVVKQNPIGPFMLPHPGTHIFASLYGVVCNAIQSSIQNQEKCTYDNIIKRCIGHWYSDVPGYYVHIDYVNVKYLIPESFVKMLKFQQFFDIMNRTKNELIFSFAGEKNLSTQIIIYACGYSQCSSNMNAETISSLLYGSSSLNCFGDPDILPITKERVNYILQDLLFKTENHINENSTRLERIIEIIRVNDFFNHGYTYSQLINLLLQHGVTQEEFQSYQILYSPEFYVYHDFIGIRPVYQFTPESYNYNQDVVLFPIQETLKKENFLSFEDSIRYIFYSNLDKKSSLKYDEICSLFMKQKYFYRLEEKTKKQVQVTESILKEDLFIFLNTSPAIYQTGSNLYSILTPEVEFDFYGCLYFRAIKKAILEQSGTYEYLFPIPYGYVEQVQHCVIPSIDQQINCVLFLRRAKMFLYFQKKTNYQVRIVENESSQNLDNYINCQNVFMHYSNQGALDLQNISLFVHQQTAQQESCHPKEEPRQRRQQTHHEKKLCPHRRNFQPCMA